MGDSFVGIQARLMSQALRKLTGAVSRSNTSLVFTNQLREKIGVMFGNPETTPGGRALKFYASVRLDIRRIETIKTGTESVGNRVRVKVVKNKVAPPFRVAEFDVMYGEGVSKEGGLLDVGVAMDVVTKTGAWFTFGETRLGQGREASKDFLKANPDVAAEIERRIRGKINEVDAAGRGHRRGRVARGEPRRGAERRGASPSGARPRPRSTTRRVVLEAALRFLEARARSDRRGPAPADQAGYRPDLVDGAIARLTELGHARRRGVRAGMGRVARSGAAARRARAAAGARAARASIGRSSTRCSRSGATSWRSGTRASISRRLAGCSRGNARALARVADPRARRQRAYALLARNGFDPDVCRQASAELVAEPDALD